MFFVNKIDIIKIDFILGSNKKSTIFVSKGWDKREKILFVCLKKIAIIKIERDRER